MSEELKKLNELHVDIWHLHKKYYPLPDDDKGWDDLIFDIGALREKYPDNSELGSIRHELVRAVVNTLDSRYYEGRHYDRNNI